MKNIILLGPPGAGKGTQAKKLSSILSVPHISVGDMFRYHIKNDTGIGRTVKELINQGKLAPDEITNAMVENRFCESDIKNGFLLDGFPRSLFQAKKLNEILIELNTKLFYAINIFITDNEIQKRLLNRAQIENRVDDANLSSIQNRIDIYKKQSESYLNFYESQNILKNVDGIGTIDEIFNRIMKIDFN
jgi:adenylate kinase